MPRRLRGERDADDAVQPAGPQQVSAIRQRTSACVSIRQHASAYVSIRQHTSAYVSIRQHTSAYVSVERTTDDPVESNGPQQLSAIRQHTSAYVSIRQHASAYVSIGPQQLSVKRVSICTFVLVKKVK